MNSNESKSAGWFSDDLLAIGFGVLILGISLACVSVDYIADGSGTDRVAVNSGIDSWLSKPAGWTNQPSEAFFPVDKKQGTTGNLLGGIGVAGFVSLVLFGLGIRLRGESLRAFAPAFACLFLLALVAYLLAGQKVIKAYNLEFAIWALFAGLVISNTLGTPRWMQPALRTELYIKTGLVIFGAEILLGRLLALGLPGVFVAWVVTPTVLITTFWFGQKILKMRSPSLNMVISADMSVCGVSAAIATAAACKAKKEELSLAIGLSLSFTAIMMVVMPLVIRLIGMDPILGGAWIGGTIDATGAVAAAGATLGESAETVAVTIKMIQNILIGVVSFFVAMYWVTFVEQREDGARPGISEIWIRFPKFVLGFMAASLVFSLLHAYVVNGPEIVDALTGPTKTLRGWFFCLAFVSIGLETDFRALAGHLSGGKPLILYVCGQALNLILTLLMAWLMFRVIFPDAAAGLSP